MKKYLIIPAFVLGTVLFLFAAHQFRTPAETPSQKSTSVENNLVNASNTKTKHEVLNSKGKHIGKIDANAYTQAPQPRSIKAQELPLKEGNAYVRSTKPTTKSNFKEISKQEKILDALNKKLTFLQSQPKSAENDKAIQTVLNQISQLEKLSSK